MCLSWASGEDSGEEWEGSGIFTFVYCDHKPRLECVTFALTPAFLMNLDLPQFPLTPALSPGLFITHIYFCLLSLR